MGRDRDVERSFMEAAQQSGSRLPTGVRWGYVKGTIMPDVSASGALHTNIPAREIAGTGSPILGRMTLGKPGKKNSFADIVRS